MDLNEYEVLPDAMGIEEVEALCIRFLKEDATCYADDSIEKCIFFVISSGIRTNFLPSLSERL